MSRTSKRSRAFSLVELSCAVGVMALLAGLLIPVLSGARRASRQVACAGNLRQWGAAMHLYAGDNDGFLPRRGQGVQPTVQVQRPGDWFNALPKYLKSPPYCALLAQGGVARPGGEASVWLCPEAAEFAGDNYWSYGMNMGLSVESAAQNGGQPDNLMKVGDTARLVAFADGPGNYCAVFPSRVAGGYNPVARHKGAVNLCFLDGHVAAVPGTYVGVGTGLVERGDVRWHPPGNTWNNAQ